MKGKWKLSSCVLMSVWIQGGGVAALGRGCWKYRLQATKRFFWLLIGNGSSA
jgi:hypothetical protein